MGKFKLPESGQKMWNDAVKIVMLVLVLAIVFTVASVLPQKAGRGEINPPANAKDFIGMDAETVKIRLEEAGFSKIELIALDDLKFGINQAVPSQVSAYAFPANFVGFFVKNSCRTAHLAAPPLGQRGNAAQHCTPASF